MLDGLDKIDWSKLVHAYGSAEDVPGLLRQLASADEEERAEAIQELYGNIWHQGTVYKATARAAPFLIELLQADPVEGKDEILVLLAHLAKGTSYHDVHQHLPLHQEQAKAVEWREEIQKELGWVRSVKAAVRDGENVYSKFLEDEDPRLRDRAAYLLGSLERPAPKLADNVWRRFENEDREHVRASLLLAFGRLAEPTEANRAPLLALLVSSQSKSVKLAAAMSLVCLAPADVSRECLVVLLDAIESPDDYGDIAESVWAEIDDFTMLVMNHIARLGAKPASVAESILAQRLPTREGNEAIRIAEVLLNLSFRTTLRRDATFNSLSEPQQRAARLMATSQNLWRESTGRRETESNRISLLLRSCGLPDEQSKLLRFIENPASPAMLLPKAEDRPGRSGWLKRLFKGKRES